MGDHHLEVLVEENQKGRQISGWRKHEASGVLPFNPRSYWRSQREMAKHGINTVSGDQVHIDKHPLTQCALYGGLQLYASLGQGSASTQCSMNPKQALKAPKRHVISRRGATRPSPFLIRHCELVNWRL